MADTIFISVERRWDKWRLTIKERQCEFWDSQLSTTMSDSTKPLVLYTAPTPNGISVSIFLEDLRAINSVVDYEWACSKAGTLSTMSNISGQGQKNQHPEQYTEGTHLNHTPGLRLLHSRLCWNRCLFYRNLGSLRWTLTVESPSSPIALVEIFTYSKHPLFCYILLRISTKITYFGLMLRRTRKIIVKCFSGFFSL